MKSLCPRLVFGLLLFGIIGGSSAWAAAKSPQAAANREALGLGPLKESAAFEQYRRRGPSILSDLIYLIDRFGEGDFHIRYDGIYYPAKVAAPFARWFLKRYYRGQTPSGWVMQWCNASAITGDLIWVKAKDGSFYLAREVLFEELKLLGQTAETVDTGG